MGKKMKKAKRRKEILEKEKEKQYMYYDSDSDSEADDTESYEEEDDNDDNRSSRQLFFFLILAQPKNQVQYFRTVCQFVRQWETMFGALRGIVCPAMGRLVGNVEKESRSNRYESYCKVLQKYFIFYSADKYNMNDYLHRPKVELDMQYAHMWVENNLHLTMENLRK